MKLTCLLSRGANAPAERLLLILCLCLFGLSHSALAQQTTGTVQGKVLDQTGAAVAGADLTLTNVNTGTSIQQRSSGEGTYIFNLVPPGSYRLKTTLAGFKTSETAGIMVEVSRNTVQDVTLTPGGLEETVQVSSRAENIDTQTAVVSTNIGTRYILELPSASRNGLAAAEMAPGVTLDTSSLTGGSQVLGQNGIGANVSGGRRQQNTFYLDGTDNTGALRNLGLQMPNPEAIQEVQVTTSTNSAEFGKQPGGYFNVITKSGTNNFHGSLFYFGVNQALNANDWGRNKEGLERAPANLKQYGATLGGPVIKNKTFFFASYQRYQDKRVVLNNTVRFPTARFIAGDFSEFAGQLYYPNYPDIPANLRNQPIPGNNLAAAGLLDPVAVNLAKALIPTVAKLGDRLVWEFTEPPQSHEILGKLDHNFSPAQNLQFSYFRVLGATKTQVSSTPNYSTGFDDVDQTTMAVRHIWTIRPSLIVESRFSRADHLNIRDTDPSLVGRDLSDFGAKWPTTIQGGKKYLPGINIRDGFDSSQVGNAGRFEQENYRFGSTLTWNRGQHNLKFGYEAQRSQVLRLDEHDNTLFRFQRLFSNRGQAASASIPNATFAYSFADFMMGRTDNFGTNAIIDYNLSGWSHYAFVQDQWRVTRRLTLNPGLRYEIYAPATEASGRSAAFIEGHKSNQFPAAPLHVAFQGDAGIPEGFVRQDKNNFAPRIGAAYDLFGDGRTALRAGFGVYYSYPASQIRVWTADNLPWRIQQPANEARLLDPWGTSSTPRFAQPPTPFPRDIREFVSRNPFPLTPPYTRIVGFSPDFETPRSYQWNVSAERELSNGITATVAYVGNRGRHLLQAYPFNYARYKNVGSSPPSLDSANVLARVPFADLNRFSILMVTDANSWYDALQLSSNVRLGRRLTSRFTYVYARGTGDGGGFSGGNAIADEDPSDFTFQTNNPANPRAERGNRERRHTFRAFYVYDLPLPVSNQRLLGKLFGGWQASGSVGVFSGNPLDIILGYDANFDATTNSPQDRPDLVKPISYTSGAKEQRIQQYFDITSFARPTITATNLFGTLPRNALWGPGAWTTDVAFAKNFVIRNEMKAQVRMEMYNLFNHPNLGTPVTTLTSSDFGKILRLNGNRTMQYAIKFYF